MAEAVPRRRVPGDHLDAIHVKIRDGQVANWPIYVALAVTCEGVATSSGCEPAMAARAPSTGCTCSPNSKTVAWPMCSWLCDWLAGLPDAITTVWSQTITQTCAVHLLRKSFRYAGRHQWDAIAKAIKPVYTALAEAAARERLVEFAEAGRPVSGDPVESIAGGVQLLPRRSTLERDLLDRRPAEHSAPSQVVILHL